MAGFPLTGVDPANPTPGIIREIKFAQGVSSSSGTARNVLLLGNKTSGGSETVNTIGDAIADHDDAVARLGYHSELLLMYRSWVAVDPLATIFACCVTDPAGTAAAADFVIATTATAASTIKFTCVGETIQVAVASGDTATVQGAALAAAINSQLFWPVSAANVSGTVTVTCSNTGTRGDLVIARCRASYSVSAASTITKGNVIAGVGADDQTTAITLLDNVDCYYQVNSKHTTSAPTATDNGVGEHLTKVTQIVLPAVGKSAIAMFGLVGTQAQATTVATASPCNSARAVFFHAENNDWTPAMIAAHCGAVKRSQEIAHAGANLTNYGLNDGDVFLIPDPYDKADRPTATEVTADLNNGVTPIGFTGQGKSFIIRQITSRSLTGTANDYRVREGHIPSAIDYFWETLKVRYATSAQPFVANDPIATEKPLPGVTYPGQVKALVSKLIDDMIDGVPGGPILDPSFRADMKKSIECVRLTDGISLRCRPIAVKHLNRSQFLLLESSEAY